MKEIILKQYVKILETLGISVSKKKEIMIGALFLLVIVTGSVVYATGNHDETVPTASTTNNEQVVVRKVGDVDQDGISQEGLNSFYGEITSKDVASIHASREGVITSWNVSVGEHVEAGEVLGTVTVTGASAEQQMQLALQQSNALKAQLDVDTANKIATSTQAAYEKISSSLQSVAQKQRALYDGSNGNIAATYQTELQAITAKQSLFAEKLQDFAKSVLVEVYPKLSANQQDPLVVRYGYLQLKFGVASANSSLQNEYQNYLPTYIELVKKRTATQNDVRVFLDKTTEILSASFATEAFPQTDIDALLGRIQVAQSDFRDLSNTLSQATVDKASKERERSQLDIELTRSLAGFENDLSLKKLEQLSAQERASNEAKGARLLAERLATSAGGVVPIVASREGIVASIDKDVGSYITLQEQIGLISTAHPTKLVRFTIPPAWTEIKKGDTLAVTWRSEFGSSNAVITGISPVINEKGGHQAEAQIASESVFPIGASVQIIPENSKKGVFVNRKAIVFEGAKPYVWIVIENNTIRKEAVVPGRQLGEYVEILSGLERGFSYLVILDPSVVLTKGKNVADFTQSSGGTTTKKVIQNENVPHSHDE